MNQILVTDKVFITPEFKRKKKAYKFHFMLSIFAVCLLTSYCIYASYDRDKSEEVSQMLLADMENSEMVLDTTTVPVDYSTMRREDNVIVVVLDPNSEREQEEIKLEDIVANSVLDTTIYKASDGTEYTTIAKIYIPKIDVTYPILSQTHSGVLDELMKISVCKFWGANPNEVGNFCIVGHNYRDNKFFSKVPKQIQIGDTIDITDTKGKTLIYEVYDKYIVDPNDVECTNQDTDGKREVTLITCTNSGKQRVIVKCVEREQ